MPGRVMADEAERGVSRSTGTVPEDGFAACVPELTVTNIAESLAFWCGLLGFEVAYDRPEARFAYLRRGPVQVMLCERNGNWEVGEMSRPFGRGINLQMMVERVEPILAALDAGGWPLFRGRRTHGIGRASASVASASSLCWTPMATCCASQRICSPARENAEAIHAWRARLDAVRRRLHNARLSRRGSAPPFVMD